MLSITETQDFWSSLRYRKIDWRIFIGSRIIQFGVPGTICDITESNLFVVDFDSHVSVDFNSKEHENPPHRARLFKPDQIEIDARIMKAVQEAPVDEKEREEDRLRVASYHKFLMANEPLEDDGGGGGDSVFDSGSRVAEDDWEYHAVMNQVEHGLYEVHLQEIEQLTDKANSTKQITNKDAEFLVKYSEILNLNGLDSLTEELANILGAHMGVLLLNGLQELSPGVARWLGYHAGELYLDGLCEISDESLMALLRDFRELGFEMDYSKMQSRESAIQRLHRKNIFQHSYNLLIQPEFISLSGITILSERQAEAISHNDTKFNKLLFRGLTEISPNAILNLTTKTPIEKLDERFGINAENLSAYYDAGSFPGFLSNYPKDFVIAMSRYLDVPIQDIHHEQIEALTEIRLEGYSSAFYVKALCHLTNLQEITLTNTQISDLEPLRHLANLRVLNIESTQVSDLTPLQSLINLRELEISNTPVSDLEPLRYLTNLQELNLNFTQVSDLTPLHNLADLRELWLRDTPVSDLNPLKALTKLERIYLSGSHVSDVAPLQSLTGLKTLSLKGTQVSDVMPLQRLIHLQRLELERCPALADIAMMASLRNSLPNTEISPEPSSSKSSVVASTQPVAAIVESEETPDLTPSATPREQRLAVAARAVESAEFPVIEQRFAGTDNPDVTQFASAREIVTTAIAGGKRAMAARKALCALGRSPETRAEIQQALDNSKNHGLKDQIGADFSADLSRLASEYGTGWLEEEPSPELVKMWLKKSTEKRDEKALCERVTHCFTCGAVIRSSLYSRCKLCRTFGVH